MNTFIFQVENGNVVGESPTKNSFGRTAWGSPSSSPNSEMISDMIYDVPFSSPLQKISSRVFDNERQGQRNMVVWFGSLAEMQGI